MLKQIVAGIVGVVTLAGVAEAGPFEDWVTAFNRGDCAAALKLIRPFAEHAPCVLAM